MNPIHWACLSRIGREILRIAYGFKSRSQTMFMKHSTIAERIGCSRATVLRWIERFCEMGWFKLQKRRSRFCEYNVSNVTVTPPVTSDATSQRRSSLVNYVAERKATSKAKEPYTWTDHKKCALLIMQGKTFDEAMALSQETLA